MLIISMTTGEKIRYYRELKNMSLSQLAAKIGCYSWVLEMLEQGKMQLTPYSLEIIAGALDVPLERLNGGDLANATTGEKIRHYRKSKGLSRSELTRIVGRKCGTISLIESGKQRVSENRLAVYAEALDVSIEELKGVDFVEPLVISDDMTTGQRIRFYRQRKGLMQRELAELVGYKGDSAIGQIESGQYGVSFKRLAAISNALNVSIEELKGVDFDEVFIKTSLLPSYDSMTTGQRYDSIVNAIACLNPN